MQPKRASSLWSSTLRLTGGLLGLWLLVNLLGPWFARDLDRLMSGSFPFWVAAEGALVIYLGIIVWYAIAMDRIEQRYLRDRPTEPAAGEPVHK